MMTTILVARCDSTNSSSSTCGVSSGSLLLLEPRQLIRSSVGFEFGPNHFPGAQEPGNGKVKFGRKHVPEKLCAFAQWEILEQTRPRCESDRTCSIVR